jgi:signal transduction histidine kinase
MRYFFFPHLDPHDSQATRANVTLKYVDDVDDNSNPLLVILDKQKIGMVMRSLIASSLHMTPESGSIEITLGLVSDLDGPPEDRPRDEERSFIRVPNTTDALRSDSTMVRVTIKDTGAGIPKVWSSPLLHSRCGPRQPFRQYSKTQLNSDRLIINKA